MQKYLGQICLLVSDPYFNACNSVDFWFKILSCLESEAPRNACSSVHIYQLTEQNMQDIIVLESTNLH